VQWYHPENACRVIKDNGGLDLVDYLLMRGITAALLDILSCNYTGERMHLKMIAESEPVHCDSHMVEDDAGLIEEVDVDAGTVLVNTIILTIFFLFFLFFICKPPWYNARSGYFVSYKISGFDLFET
jgi:hypothetical protein